MINRLTLSDASLTLPLLKLKLCFLGEGGGKKAFEVIVQMSCLLY